MNESIETMADVLAAFGGRRRGAGWTFSTAAGAYRVGRRSGAGWVVQAIARGGDPGEAVFASEQQAARYVAYHLDPPPPNPRIRPVDELVNREERYVLGLDLESGRHYAAFPVTIGVADYSEYYAVTDEHYAQLLADPDAALAFVEECRRHEHDDLLMQQPGWNRGIPG